MSVNTAHAENGVLIHAGEYILLHSDNISMEFNGQDNPVFKGSKQGRVYLTSHRMIYNNKKQGDSLQSFSAPFIAMTDLELEQPVFGANYIKGKVRAQPNGNFVGEVKFKLFFKSGGAIEYGQALRRAAMTAQSNLRNGGFSDDPPPYTPSGAWHEAPPPAYQPPPGYYGWLPTHDAFTGPAPNSVFVSDNPPPYMGIGGPPPYNPAPYGGGGAPQQPQYNPNQQNWGGFSAPQTPPQQPQPGGWGAPAGGGFVPAGGYQPPPYGNGAPGYGTPDYGVPAGYGAPGGFAPPSAGGGGGYGPGAGDYGQPAAGGYGPPAGGYAPPAGGYAPPAGGYAPQNGGYAPPSGGFAPPNGGYAPPAGGYAPPPAGYGQPQHQPQQQQPQQHSQQPQEPPSWNGFSLPPSDPARPHGGAAPPPNSKEAEALASAQNTTTNQRGNARNSDMPPSYHDLPPNYNETRKNQ